LLLLIAEKESNMTLKFDPKKFDPNADASDRPVKDITQPGRAVQIVGGVRPPATSKPEIDLGKFWRALSDGDEHLEFCEYQEALGCYELAVNMLRHGDASWRLIHDIPGAFIGRARCLSRLGRHNEAVAAFDEELARRGITDDTPLEWWQAEVVMNNGLALCNAGRREEGRACYTRVLAASRAEWEKGTVDAGTNLALTLFNMGESYDDMDGNALALRYCDESLAIHHALAAKRGGAPSVDKACVLSAKCRALICAGLLDEAVSLGQEAATILEAKAAQPDKLHLTGDLSRVLLRVGKALQGLRRDIEASDYFRRATELAHEVKRNRGTFREPVEQ
jgi:tetratricopeptide (TPR) repeat protein